MLRARRRSYSFHVAMCRRAPASVPWPRAGARLPDTDVSFVIMRRTITSRERLQHDAL